MVCIIRYLVVGLVHSVVVGGVCFLVVPIFGGLVAFLSVDLVVWLCNCVVVGIVDRVFVCKC